MLTLILTHWKLPETKNKHVRTIKKELRYLKAWRKSVSTMPEFDPTDLETKFPAVLTPRKLKLDQWELSFIDENTELTKHKENGNAQQNIVYLNVDDVSRFNEFPSL